MDQEQLERIASLFDVLAKFDRDVIAPSPVSFALAQAAAACAVALPDVPVSALAGIDVYSAHCSVCKAVPQTPCATPGAVGWVHSPRLMSALLLVVLPVARDAVLERLLAPLFLELAAKAALPGGGR